MKDLENVIEIIRPCNGEILLIDNYYIHIANTLKEKFGEKLYKIVDLYKHKLNESIELVNNYYDEDILNEENCFISGSSLYTLLYFDAFSDIDLFVNFDKLKFLHISRYRNDNFGNIIYTHTIHVPTDIHLIKLINGVQVIFNYEIRSKMFSTYEIKKILTKNFDFAHCCSFFYKGKLYIPYDTCNAILNKKLVLINKENDIIKKYKRVKKFVDDYLLSLD